jgi:pyruvate kinase
MARRTKIVATVGPALDDPAVLEAAIRAGIDVARINFSHGVADEHLARVARFREIAAKVGKAVAILADLPGPKLRCRLDAARKMTVGDTVTFSLADVPVEPGDIVLTEPELLAGVKPGHRVLLDDGRLQMTAGAITNNRLSATVTVGGELKPNKGINLPDTALNISAVTDRDRVAIEIAAKAKADWLALSFVRGPEAAVELRAVARGYGYKGPILAKLERPEAVIRAATIILAFDGVMVARGDLGVEIPLEKVPLAQKGIIAQARAAGKPVITATDMLDSMQNNPRPTRAEASDVANAIFDGTDAVMLSGETAVGKYPVEAVACMARIAETVESHLEGIGREHTTLSIGSTVDDADEPIATAACSLAREVNAAAIVTPTLSGRTARLLARHRPWPRIVAPSPSEAVLRQMALVWGLTPVPMSPLSTGDDRMAAAVRDSHMANAVAEGDRVVVLAGHPIEGGQRFPTVRVVKVGPNGSSLEP